MKEPSDVIAAAQNLRSSPPPTGELLDALLKRDQDGEHLLARLRDARQFILVRALLDIVAQREDLLPERAEALRQQYALSLYKDPDLPAKPRLDAALEKLADGRELLDSEDPETLGLAGAIHRRYWDLDGHQAHLERALRFYERGHRIAVATSGVFAEDKGYTGINAAFLEDQLAWRGAGAMAAPTRIEQAHRDQARRIRAEVIEHLEPLIEADPGVGRQWWPVATLIEAHFGNGDFTAARRVFETHKPSAPATWKAESTFRQLVGLARVQGHFDPRTGEIGNAEALDCLHTLLGGHDPKIVSTADQKVGLALSGGGFRASFYEIGVLAALAEFELLPLVEVISTVSGGSILGAHYYLALREKLQSVEDGKLTREDYLEVVENVANTFLRGVQMNIRTRVVLEPQDTLRMFMSSKYSRTMKAGELYERHIYREITRSDAPILMRDLCIHPLGDPEKEFRPKVHNWRRRHKVPILVLNSTSLNTGHNWQFTATWMGEPLSETDIDSNPRLRRMYYTDLEHTPAAQHADLRLGYAVAASACVPGLFEPLTLSNLYDKSGVPEGPTSVQLVDGGVHDNQGIGSLLEQECNVLIVADASGQIPYEREPSSTVLGSALRSNTAMMARIREAEYMDVKVQTEVGRRKGLAFVHLKQGLHQAPLNWLGCEQPKTDTENPHDLAGAAPKTPYGILKSVQEKLARIRTDLDSFSDIEAYALMYSGYRAARQTIPERIDTLPLKAGEHDRWPFLVVADALTGREADSKFAEKVERHLEVGAKNAFKVWSLNGLLSALRWAILVLGGAALLWWAFANQGVSLLSVGTVAWIAASAIVTWALGKWAGKLTRPRQLLVRIVTIAGLTVFGWLVAWIHLKIFDRLFKKLGSLADRRLPAGTKPGDSASQPISDGPFRGPQPGQREAGGGKQQRPA